MGYEENRAAKPFSVTPWGVARAIAQHVRRLRLRRQTRQILSHLNDAQLKDIGLTRGDIENEKW